MIDVRKLQRELRHAAAQPADIHVLRVDVRGLRASALRVQGNRSGVAERGRRAGGLIIGLLHQASELAPKLAVELKSAEMWWLPSVVKEVASAAWPALFRLMVPRLLLPSKKVTELCVTGWPLEV